MDWKRLRDVTTFPLDTGETLDTPPTSREGAIPLLRIEVNGRAVTSVHFVFEVVDDATGAHQVGTFALTIYAEGSERSSTVRLTGDPQGLIEPTQYVRDLRYTAATFSNAAFNTIIPVQLSGERKIWTRLVTAAALNGCTGRLYWRPVG